jgi:putative acetyltransferase
MLYGVGVERDSIDVERAMPAVPPKLRPYAATDEAAAIELWRRTWQSTYPSIDFKARVPWWTERWRSKLVPEASIVVAEAAGGMVGFVTVEADTGYLDQIVVAPECWGDGLAEILLAEARRLSPKQLVLHVNTDNTRAIHFYEKHGFTFAGDDINPVSGRPVYRMRWRP